MKAIPIIPGELYRVTCGSRSAEVPAINGAEAIANALGGL